MGITKEEDKLRIFPSLMHGSKAQFVQTELRLTQTWGDMVTKFKSLFDVSKEVVIADLRAL